MDVAISRWWPALDLAVDDSAPQDLAFALLDDFNPTAIDDSRPEALRVFFSSAVDRDEALRALSSRFSISPVDVADEGWAERSQAGLRSVRAGQLIVAPPWDLPTAHEGPRTIVIRPSMGFGTGHHATTRLCLRALQTVSLAGASVVDVGTGSGVLAIAAARLGASRVVAIDVDRDATDCALENVASNHVADRVTVLTADACQVRESGFDVLTANLTSALLRALAERLLRMVHSGGHLILSGFMLHEEDDVAGQFAPPARMALRDEEDGWGVLVLRVPAHSIK